MSQNHYMYSWTVSDSPIGVASSQMVHIRNDIHPTWTANALWEVVRYPWLFKPPTELNSKMYFSNIKQIKWWGFIRLWQSNVCDNLLHGRRLIALKIYARLTSCIMQWIPFCCCSFQHDLVCLPNNGCTSLCRTGYHSYEPGTSRQKVAIHRRISASKGT